MTLWLFISVLFFLSRFEIFQEFVQEQILCLFCNQRHSLLSKPSNHREWWQFNRFPLSLCIKLDVQVDEGNHCSCSAGTFLTMNQKFCWISFSHLIIFLETFMCTLNKCCAIFNNSKQIWQYIWSWIRIWSPAQEMVVFQFMDSFFVMLA